MIGLTFLIAVAFLFKFKVAGEQKGSGSQKHRSRTATRPMYSLASVGESSGPLGSGEMFKRRVAPMLALLFVMFFAQTAHAFFDPPWITPTNPVAGETVSVNIRLGICDAFVQREGYPQITQEGNAIRIVEYGDHYEAGDEQCIFGIGTATQTVGAYSAGDYTLTVDLIYPHPVFGPTILNIGVVSFTVVAPPMQASVPVPASGLFSGLVLLTLMLVLAVWTLRAQRLELLFLLAICAPFGARAGEPVFICVTPTTTAGAPTPVQIMAWINSSPRSGTPPLEAFKTKAPLGSTWLIPDRATGDFLIWLNANPNSARKKLEDCQLMTFAAEDAAVALAALQADPYVASASVTPTYELHSVELTDFVIAPEPEELLGGDEQYGWFDMNVDAAWQLAGGYALIGQIDAGLFEQHIGLRQFDGSTYVGGNFIKAASKDIGLTAQPAQSGFDPTNVDEKKLMWINAGNAGSCTTVGAFMPPANLGHGTHVAGLLAANGASGLGVQGTCKHCGISVWRSVFLQCYTDPPPARVLPKFNNDAANRGKAQAVDTGVQVLNMSFGASSHSEVYDCRTAYRNFPMCLAIDYAAGRDVAMVASSGNVRDELDFPASDKRVVSAGGFVQNLTFWNDTGNCPPPPNQGQCGSNFSKLGTAGYKTHQELLGSAKQVLSTTYPNTTWNDFGCGDGYGTPMGDGLGWCTGTSMSAPQIAGVVGLLRSINPLVPVSVPEPTADVKPGLRSVLVQTASRVGAWDPYLGYGIPDAAEAARKVLGKVDRVVVRNRVTPLFRLWESTTKDFADTTSPQYALSLMINQAKKYVQPTSGLGAEPKVPGYAFPYDIDDPTISNDTYDTTLPAAPRAAVYVLTTEYRSRTEWPALIPLYLMDKTYSGGKDYMLVTTTAEIQTAYNGGVNGYNLRTIQGYIYQPCTPESTCIPPGAVKLWRQYRTADNDCAVFLNSEKSAFETAGYISACPAGATTMIGYAYPSTDSNSDGITDNDSDGDGLLDGFEYVVGTDPHAADSDLDGTTDAVEFPMIGIPVDDPCKDGPLGARNCGADIIFKNGFNP